MVMNWWWWAQPLSINNTLILCKTIFQVTKSCQNDLHIKIYRPDVNYSNDIQKPLTLSVDWEATSSQRRAPDRITSFSYRLNHPTIPRPPPYAVIQNNTFSFHMYTCFVSFPALHLQNPWLFYIISQCGIW